MATAPGQYELLQSVITPAIKRLALRRATKSGNLFSGERLTVKMPKHQVKIALLLVQMINPFEDLSMEEEALLRGISSKTLRLRKAQNRLRLSARL
jgi:hypothetical protein